MGLTFDDETVSLPLLPKLNGVEGGRIAATGDEIDGIG